MTEQKRCLRAFAALEFKLASMRAALRRSIESLRPMAPPAPRPKKPHNPDARPDDAPSPESSRTPRRDVPRDLPSLPDDDVATPSPEPSEATSSPMAALTRAAAKRRSQRPPDVVAAEPARPSSSRHVLPRRPLDPAAVAAIDARVGVVENVDVEVSDEMFAADLALIEREIASIVSRVPKDTGRPREEDEAPEVCAGAADCPDRVVRRNMCEKHLRETGRERQRRENAKSRKKVASRVAVARAV